MYIYLKMGLEQLQNPLTEMFNKILQVEELPSQWKTSKIILLQTKKAPKMKLTRTIRTLAFGPQFRLNYAQIV